MNYLSDPWKTGNSSNVTDNIANDSRISKVKNSLKGLDNNEEPWIKLAHLISEEDADESSFKEFLSQVEDINDTSTTGVTLLIYSIVFDRRVFVELLHGTGKLNANVADKLYGLSPLMWCFVLNRQQCCVELLNFVDELDLSYESPGGFTALDLVIPGTAMYEFTRQHKLQDLVRNGSAVHEDMYKAPAAVFATNDVDHTLDQIDLQTAGLKLDETEFYHDSAIAPQNDGINQISNTEDRSFDFNHLMPSEYIEFADYDIPRLLELIISLPSRKPHKTSIPAAIIFQCLRYADHIKQSVSLVESMAHLSLTKILSSVSSASGGVLNEQAGDIVLQSYWLSCLNFLFYYLCRQDGFFKRYPSILQEIIDGMRSLVIELNSSIHLRLVPLIDSTILEHTTIAEVKETIYKKDWNLFKKKKQRNTKGNARDSYEETLAMLYPPSLDEQMKPSPLKIVQIFGALTYVLDLHQVHPLIAQQCLSLAVEWFSATLFNRIIDNKKKSLSRAHAVQIRLNISVIQDWIKNHDFKAAMPSMVDEFMWKRFPYTLIFDLSEIDGAHKPFELRNVTFFSPVNNNHTEDVNNSIFFYQSFYHISQIHLEPCMQLLQWLQVATSLEDEESLMSTLSILDKLSPSQLLKTVGRYRYDSDEQKFRSSLKKTLSGQCKESPTTEYHLPEQPLHALTLPTITELTDMYTQREDVEELLPFLPLDIQDDVDEIHDQNVRQRQIEEEKEDIESTSGDSDVDALSEPPAIAGETGDELFKELHAPSTAAQRPVWAINNDIEANPW